MDDAARAVVVTGAGGAFCAGTDLADLADTPEDQRGNRGRREPVGEGEAGWQPPWPIVACPKPVIGAGTVLLPRLIGPTSAARLLFSGEIIDAGEASRLGLVTAVVEPDQLAAAAEAEARRYLDASPFALRRTKELLYAGMFRAVDEHVHEPARLLQECFVSDDHREGVAAFLEHRPAVFTGR